MLWPTPQAIGMRALWHSLYAVSRRRITASLTVERLDVCFELEAALRTGQETWLESIGG